MRGNAGGKHIHHLLRRLCSPRGSRLHWQCCTNWGSSLLATTDPSCPSFPPCFQVCTVCFYFTSGLRGGADHVWTFIALMFASLVVVESLMMVGGGDRAGRGACRRRRPQLTCAPKQERQQAQRKWWAPAAPCTTSRAPRLSRQAIAPLVPHYLMGIAVGAGVLGIFM